MTNNHALLADSRSVTIIRVGGAALIFAAVAFLAVFLYLAARFNYPEVLDGPASLVLPDLLATGKAGWLAWAIYSLLPLCWIPAAMGAFYALRSKSEGIALTGISFAVVSSVAMILGLMRWPSLHWELARSWVAEPSARPALNAIFDGANRYLGNYIGEFLGELCFCIFFLLSASAMLKQSRSFPRWVAWFGLLAGAAGLVGMFRNVTNTVAPIAELNNYLLPLWMVIFGVALLRTTRMSAVIAVGPIPNAA